MDQETNQDDFSFEEFLTSEDSKKEFGVETVESVPTIETTQTDVIETPSTSQDTTDTQSVEVVESVQEPTEQVSHETRPEGMPVRATDEPDWKYEYRMEIWEKQQALKNASSDSERTAIKSDMTSIRKEMAQRARETEEVEYTEQPQQDIASIVEFELNKREQIQTIDRAEADFLKRHPELKNPIAYDNFIQFVGENFNLQGKTYKGITAQLEMAHEILFPKNVQKRMEEAKKVEDKMNAVDFSGSTASDDVPTEKVEQKKLVEEIKKTSGNDFGWAID